MTRTSSRMPKADRPLGIATFTPTLTALAIAACFAPAQIAMANPTGAQIAAGQASLATQGNKLTVTNTPGTIINWQQFNIGQGETTHFQQQAAGSAVLNRVVTNSPSQIYGTLSSNGQVWLVNQSGIVIGPNAQINVNQLVASTLNISDSNFLSRTFNFSGGDGQLKNMGQISTPLGGSVYLIGSQVSNEGIITTPQGRILLAAGKEISLTDTAGPEVSVTLKASDSQAINLGTLSASGGRIDMFGALIDQQGHINASSAQVDAQGRITLSASNTATVGGTLTTAHDTAKGGDITITGDNVVVADSARLNASGAIGGGNILIGGDWQGQNSAIQNASNLSFAAGASASADATQNGDGGKIVLWANERTVFKGQLSAQGGPQGGNGGQVETSGKVSFVPGGSVNTLASKGLSGKWLIDPAKICILPTAGSCIWAADPNASQATVYSTDELNVMLRSSDVNLQADDYLAFLPNGGKWTLAGDLKSTPSVSLYAPYFFLNGSIEGSAFPTLNFNANASNSTSATFSSQSGVMEIAPASLFANIQYLGLMANKHIVFANGSQLSASQVSINAPTLINQGVVISSNSLSVSADFSRPPTSPLAWRHPSGDNTWSNLSFSAHWASGVTSDFQVGGDCSGKSHCVNATTVTQWVNPGEGWGGSLSIYGGSWDFSQNQSTAKVVIAGPLDELENISGAENIHISSGGDLQVDSPIRLSTATLGLFAGNSGSGSNPTVISGGQLVVNAAVEAPIVTLSTYGSGDVVLSAPITATNVVFIELANWSDGSAVSHGELRINTPNFPINAPTWGVSYLNQPSTLVAANALLASGATFYAKASEVPGIRFNDSNGIRSAYANTTAPTPTPAPTPPPTPAPTPEPTPAPTPTPQPTEPAESAQPDPCKLNPSSCVQTVPVVLQPPPPPPVSSSVVIEAKLTSSDREAAADSQKTAQAFGRISTAQMSRSELSELVRVRHELKTAAFKPALNVLEQSPNAADLPTCDGSSVVCLPADMAANSDLAAPRTPTEAALPQIERKIALVIGINQYRDKAIPQLETAVPDAVAVGKALQTHLGYEVRTLANADRAEIVTGLNRIAREVGPKDSVTVYYAGHGYLNEKTNVGYWLPSDAQVSSPQNWISNNDIARLLRLIPAQQVMLVSDSCYSGSLAREQMAGATSASPEAILNRRSVTVLSSGGEEPVSDEGKDGHSIFAYHLIKKLDEVAQMDKGASIFEAVKAEVVREFPQTPSYGGIVSSGHRSGGDYLFEKRTYR